MTLLDRISRALVIAPHPDDEILGCGGTIARLTRAGADVQVAIVTRGREPRFARSAVEQVANEALAAHQSLGISATHWLNLPAVELDTIPQADINAALCGVIEKVEPDTVFLPFAGDIHLDHRVIFESALVRCGRCDRFIRGAFLLTRHCLKRTGQHPVQQPRSFPISRSILPIPWRTNSTHSVVMPRNRRVFRTNVRSRRCRHLQPCEEPRFTVVLPRPSS